MSPRLILVVTGASGVGKSTAVATLAARRRPDISCFHFDSVGVPSLEIMERDFGGGERWQAQVTRQWLQRLAAGPPGPHVSVLDAQTRPSFVRSALEPLGRVSTRMLLIDCRPEVRLARLTARGHAELANVQMDTWAAYLRAQADALELPVLDSSDLSPEQAADVLEANVATLRAGS